MAATDYILVLDDDPDFAAIIQLLLAQQGYRADCFTRFDDAVQRGKHSAPLAILLDWKLNDVDGLDLIAPLRQQFPLAPVILVTASPSTDLAIQAIRLGAFDFLPKPIDDARLTMTLAKAIEHHRLTTLVSDIGGGNAGEAGFEEMIGTSPQMRTVYHIVGNVAPTDVSIMICGESGTGKELVARAIHKRSGAKGQFVPLNMAALPRELVESTLFGHERGSFTGAEKQRIGACEEAKDGTLFLDEIGEMPLELQAKLLRFLQERVFRRVGGTEDISSNARIVSATNREPLVEVEAGRLRADLYYRLNVVPILLPPLRERRMDIPLIATHALKLAAARHRKNLQSFDSDAMRRMIASDWPGNVRQLVHAVERIVVMNDGETVSAGMLPADLTQEASSAAKQVDVAAAVIQSAANGEIIPLAQLERRAIEHALSLYPTSAAEAARRLGISQATIYRKMKEYGLSPTGPVISK